MNQGLTINLSSDYYINGTHCFKLESSLNQYQGINIVNIIVPEDTSKVKFTLTFLKILNGHVDCRINENNAFVTVTALENNNIQEIIVEKEITTRNVTLTLIFRSANITAYIDNLRLTAQ